MRPPRPVEVVELLPAERAALLVLLESLRDEEWAAPTACAGWSVRDVALHLLGGEIGVLSRQRDGFADTSQLPPGADLSNWTDLVDYLNRINELWVRAARRISPRLLVELLRFTGDLAHAYFRELDPRAPGVTVSWAGPEPAPNWLGIAREYTERWTHQQHVRDAVGRPGLTEPRWLAPVIRTFVHALPRTLRDVAAPEGTAVRLVVAGEAGGEWVALRQGRRWLLGAGADWDPPADATVELDAGTAWRLFTRGLSPETARARARLTGDPALAEAMLRTVAIIA